MARCGVSVKEIRSWGSDGDGKKRSACFGWSGRHRKLSKSYEKKDAPQFRVPKRLRYELARWTEGGLLQRKRGFLEAECIWIEDDDVHYKFERGRGSG